MVSTPDTRHSHWYLTQAKFTARLTTGLEYSNTLISNGGLVMVQDLPNTEVLLLVSPVCMHGRGPRHCVNGMRAPICTY